MRTEWWQRGPVFLRLMRFDRPIGIYLLLWPTLWALWIAAEGWPRISTLLIFISGVILMRAAGCVINDLTDRDLDAYVTRTRDRPLVTGAVKPKEAWYVFAGLCLIAFILVLFTNAFTMVLAVIALLLAAIYPWMKRYTYWPQLVLGAAFSWAIPMAFAAETNTVPWYAWLLYSANLSWTLAYDTQYAMADRVDDLKIGIKSTAILFGDWDKTIIALLQLLMLSVLIILGMQLNLGFYYYAGLAVSAALFVFQHYSMRESTADACLKTFKQNQWVGMIIFIGIFMHYYMTSLS